MLESFLLINVVLAMTVISVIDVSGTLHLRPLCIYSENTSLHRSMGKVVSKRQGPMQPALPPAASSPAILYMYNMPAKCLKFEKYG